MDIGVGVGNVYMGRGCFLLACSFACLLALLPVASSWFWNNLYGRSRLLGSIDSTRVAQPLLISHLVATLGWLRNFDKSGVSDACLLTAYYTGCSISIGMQPLLSLLVKEETQRAVIGGWAAQRDTQTGTDVAPDFWTQALTHLCLLLLVPA